MSAKEESVGDDRDELDVESIVADQNIDPSVFTIRNALEQPDARVYTTLELHSKLIANNICDNVVNYCPQSKFTTVISTSTHRTNEVCFFLPFLTSRRLPERKMWSGLQQNRWKLSIPSFTISMFRPSSLL
jgi:hypothetical protein